MDPHPNPKKAIVSGGIILAVLGFAGYGFVRWMPKPSVDTVPDTVATTPAATTVAQVSPSPTISPATPTPDPYPGWKTFTDSSLGISFRYPADIAEKKEAGYTSFSSAPSGTDSLQYAVRDAPYVRESIDSVYGVVTDSGLTKSKIAGDNQVYTYTSGDAGCSSQFFVLPSTDKMKLAQLSLAKCSEDKETITPELSKILSSLTVSAPNTTFIDLGASINRASWKTLTSDGGWQVQYPADWSVSGCQACKVTDVHTLVTFYPTSGDDDKGGFIILDPLAPKTGTGSDIEWLHSLAGTNQQPAAWSLDTTFNGRAAYEVITANDDTNNETQTLYFLTSQRPYEISISTTASNVKNQKVTELAKYPTYTAIINSFKEK